MTLIERIEILCERAKNQRSLEEKKAESQRMQPLLNDARKLSENLATEVERFRLLRDQGIEMLTPDRAGKARNVLGRLRARFAEEGRAEDLTRGRDWNLLKDHVQATCENLRSTVDAEWRQFVETICNAQRPDDLERTLAHTDRNKTSLKLYREVYEQITKYAGSRPNDRTDFDCVRDLSRQLAEIHKEFDFDVPEEVKRFLRAVADGGATLDLLTAEVRDWIEQQQGSERYRIVARVSSK